MGLVQDVGGRLVQSFLSLDDLVLGQGLVAQGLSQLGLSGRSVAGSVAVGSNVAAPELIRQRDCCAGQLASLEAFTGSIREYQAKSVADRKENLRTFLSLANQGMALRGTSDQAAAEATARSQRQDAYASFVDSIGNLPA